MSRFRSKSFFSRGDPDPAIRNERLLQISLRRDASALPDGPDKAALLKELARQEELLGPIEKIIEGQRIQERKERIGRYGIMLPLALGMSYFPVRGILEGRVRNLFGDLDHYLDHTHGPPNPGNQYPYAYWDADPVVFVFFVLFYSLIASVFFAAAFDVVYFGRRRARTREEFDRELELARQEPLYPESKWVRRKLFGHVTYEQRISAVIAAIVIAGWLGVIAYKALEIYLN